VLNGHWHSAQGLYFTLFACLEWRKWRAELNAEEKVTAMNGINTVGDDHERQRRLEWLRRTA
jgi:hypothetical protein